MLIPFLTQPPHERTLTGRGSRVYPNVGAAGCGLVGAGGVLGLGLRPRGSLYELVLYNSYKKCMNWYKNHTVYEFVLYNLYNNCIQKLAKKDLHPGWDFNLGPKWLAIVAAPRHPPGVEHSFA